MNTKACSHREGLESWLKKRDVTYVLELILLEIHGTSQFKIINRLRAAGSVFAEDEAQLLISESRTPDDLTRMVDLRVAGLPLEHILGWAEFCGMRIIVEPGVFVPRRRTEFLVHQAAAVVRPQAVVVDVCCGSGAVGTVLSTIGEQIQLYAVDIDPAAVSCARRNVGNSGHVYQGDLYAPLPDILKGRVDVLVANAPYVPTEEIRIMPQEAREYEPQVALDGGGDGLDVQRRLVAGAPLWLAPSGTLLMETSKRQAGQTAEIFKGHGLIPIIVSSDDLQSTVVMGTRPALQLERGD